MNTLVAYASKYGCTEKCARILLEKLTGEVDLCDLKKTKVIDLTKYDKVIVGGSIYAGKVRKEVSNFCSANLTVLKEKSLGLFVCGMLEDQAEVELNNSFPSELLTKALVKEFFGGEFQFQKMKFPEKFIVKMVSKAYKSRPALDTSKDVFTISEQTFPLYMLTTYLNVVMPIFISVLIADMITDEYVNGMLTLSMIHPVTRGKLLVAKVLALVIIITLLMLYSMVLGFITGSAIFGWGEQFMFRDVNMEIDYAFSTGAGLLITLGSYAVSVIPLLTFGMVIVFLAIYLKSSGALVGISIGLIIYLSFIGEIAVGLRPFLINNYFALYWYFVLPYTFWG